MSRRDRSPQRFDTRVRIAHHWRRFPATRKGCHVALDMALLGGVVLVAIAAFFWTASNQTNVTPPVTPGPAPVTPVPVPPAPPAPAPVAQEPAPSSAPAPTTQLAAPSPPPSPAPPAAQEARSPARSRSDCAARSHSGAASRLATCSRAVAGDALGSAHRRAGAPTSACSRPARRSAPAAVRARTGGAGSQRRLRAQEPRAVGRGLGLFLGGLRAAFPAARRRLGLSAAGGHVRPGRDCRVADEDSFCLQPAAGSSARLKRKARSR
jgi:hypothetical protein